LRGIRENAARSECAAPIRVNSCSFDDELRCPRINANFREWERRLGDGRRVVVGDWRWVRAGDLAVKSHERGLSDLFVSLVV
jgi:hypothetical protein